MTTDTAPTARKTGLLVGWYTDGRYPRRVEIKVELREKGEGLELAIQSTAGRAYKVTGASPRAGEFRYSAYGEPLDFAGGQAIGEVENVTRFAPGWDAAKRDRLVDVWKRWHLNGMNAGCEHQRARGWGEKRIDESKTADAYGRHFEGQRQDSWNLLGWVRPDEHPEGLMTRPCPECGYRYGTAWLFEPLPEDVIAFVRSL